MEVVEWTSGGMNRVPLESKHFSKRLIEFSDTIKKDTAIDFTDKLLELSMESDEPITVLITSDGGDIRSGMMMIDAITGSRAPVRMICRGWAYSMAAVVFASAETRLMLPNSQLMLHEPLLGESVTGNATEIKRISDRLQEKKDQMNQLIAGYTGKTAEEIAEVTEDDHYFSPEEAVAFRLADRVIRFSDIADLINETGGAMGV